MQLRKLVYVLLVTLFPKHHRDLCWEMVILVMAVLLQNRKKRQQDLTTAYQGMQAHLAIHADCPITLKKL